MPNFLKKMHIVTFEQKKINFTNTLSRIRNNPYNYLGYVDGELYLDVESLDKTVFTRNADLIPLYNYNNMRTAKDLHVQINQLDASIGYKNINNKLVDLSDQVENLSLGAVKLRLNNLKSEAKSLKEAEEVTLTYQLESILMIVDLIDDEIFPKLHNTGCTLNKNKAVRAGLISGIITGLIGAVDGAIYGYYDVPVNPVLGGTIGGLVGFGIGFETGGQARLKTLSNSLLIVTKSRSLTESNFAQIIYVVKK